jgi:hypothetical protein
MASSSLHYGPRISDAEYDRRVVALHESAAGRGKDRDRELRRAELNIEVDHRLGQDFPSDRRRLLWAAHEQAERRRRRLPLRFLFGLLRTGSIEGAAESLARDLVKAYAKVLTPTELHTFFGDACGDERPMRSSRGEARHP